MRTAIAKIKMPLDALRNFIIVYINFFKKAASQTVPPLDISELEKRCLLASSCQVKQYHGSQQTDQLFTLQILHDSILTNGPHPVC